MRAIAIALFALAGLLVLFVATRSRNWDPDGGSAIPVRVLRRAANLTLIAILLGAIGVALYSAASCALGYPCFGME